MAAQGEAPNVIVSIRTLLNDLTSQSFYNAEHICSPARAHPEVSSSGFLSDSAINSLSMATTPQPADDMEVLSRRLPEQGEVILETP